MACPSRISLIEVYIIVYVKSKSEIVVNHKIICDKFLSIKGEKKKKAVKVFINYNKNYTIIGKNEIHSGYAVPGRDAVNQA